MAKRDLNSINIIGTLTREPEIAYTPAGLCVAKFSIANNQLVPQAGGETKEIVNYFNVKAFGNTAGNIQKFVHKGSRIVIEGQLSQNRWTDKSTGKTVSAVTISAEKIQFLSAPQKSGTSGADAGCARTSSPPDTDPWGEEEGHYGMLSSPDDDIPF